MAKSRKPVPEHSKLARPRPLAYARRQKGDKDAEPAAPADTPAEPTAAAADRGTALEAPTTSPETTTPAAQGTPETPSDAAAASDKPTEIPEIEPPPPKGEPWPDATPEPMRPVAPRARAETIAAPADASFGAPPPVPNADVPESPPFMPAPRDIPVGKPEDPARPPGAAPRGDSRSLRKGNEFALVYRVQTSVVTRSGVVGTRGQWRVVDYPTSQMASNAYAKEVSRFVAEGFSDYRD